MSDDEGLTVDQALELVHEQAQEQWPGIELDDARLRPRVEQALRRGLTRARWGDLALACACAHGDPTALERFEAAFRGVAQRAFRGAGVDVDLEDLWQGLEIRLLVKRPDAPARILGYSGEGPLRSWVKVSAVRFALNQRKSVGGADAQDAIYDALEATAMADTELELVKQHYREAFRVAFRQALGELSPQATLLLRQSLLHGMTARELGRAYGLHHTSITRRLGRIRAELVESTRARLAEDLGVGATELQSVLGLIGSRLEASFQQLQAD